jgi:pimeloyl-ACP methyl ester carboxylesterase
MRRVVLAVLALVASAAYAQERPTLSGVKMTTVDGRAVRVQAVGLQDRRQGRPVVVFEAGATNSLEVWGGIPSQVATMAPIVAYDRAGLGSSEWDDANPTPRHVAERLRQVLRQIGARALFRELLPE